MVSRHLDKSQSLGFGLGLQVKSLGTLKTFASMINIFFAFLLQLTEALHALSEYDCMSLTSIGKHILQQVLLYLLILR